MTYAVSKRGGVEDLTWEMIQNDDMGAIRMIPQRLARAAQRTLNGFVFDFLASNTAIYDGKTLFHDDHHNASANALTYDNAVAAIKAMGQQTFYGEDGVRGGGAGPGPKYLVHPTELLEEAFEVTQSPVKVVAGGNSNQPSFINRLGVEPLWAPELTDSNDWYMIADPGLMDTIEIGFMGRHARTRTVHRGQPLRRQRIQRGQDSLQDQARLRRRRPWTSAASIAARPPS